MQLALFKSAETGTGAIGIMIGDIAVIGYGYGYRPYNRYYYRPYPYYRPYAHYGYPYWYGRPGISFGFAF